MKCDFVCDIEKLVLLLSFEPSEVFPSYTLVCHKKENYNNLILVAEALRRIFVASIEVRSVANVLYINVSLASDVLDMYVNSHVICKIESDVFCSSRE